jgi:hypothetical protein
MYIVNNMLKGIIVQHILLKIGTRKAYLGIEKVADQEMTK